jgi:polyisoprenoid-binding protein YceI
MKRMFFTFLIVLLAGLSNNVKAVEWRFDHPHTNIGFSITHLVISDVTGRFNEFDGTFSSPGDDFEGSRVSITIKTASIDTDNEKRDKHLRSADFFDAEKHPEITFKSTSFEKVGDKKYKISGQFMMNGVTRDIALEATLTGVIDDPWGGTRAGFKATTTLDRYDYNLTYNKALETGGFLIGRDVDVVINVELIKK